MEQEPLKEQRVGDYVVKVYVDEDLSNDPRKWDNLGTIVVEKRCVRRYDVGDETKDNDYDEFDDFVNELESSGAVVILLYGYEDHCGFQFANLSDGRDRKPNAAIYATPAAIRKEYSLCDETWAKIYADTLPNVRRILEQEIQTYNEYLRGEVYGYAVEGPDGEEIDDGSCWGFMGGAEIDGVKIDAVDYCLYEGVCVAKNHIEWRRKEDEMANSYMAL
jgi:hypothetical protein